MAQKSKGKSTSGKRSSTKSSGSSSRSRSGARKSTAKSTKKTQNKKQNQHQFREEVTGIILCALGVFLFVSLFASASSGVWGLAVKDALMGSFGSVGYALPLVVIGIGVGIIVKKESEKRWGSIIVWSIFGLSILCVYHMFFLKSILNHRVAEIVLLEFNFADYVSDAYQVGVSTGLSAGAVGSILTYIFIKTIGVAGAYIVFITYMAAVIIYKSRMSLRSVGRDMGDRLNDSAREIQENLRERRQERQVYRERVREERAQLFIEDLHDQPENNEDVLIHVEDDHQTPTLDFLNQRHEKLHAAFTHTDKPSVPQGTAGDGETSTVDEFQWDVALHQAHKDDVVPQDSAPQIQHYEVPMQSPVDQNDLPKEDVPKVNISSDEASDDQYAFPGVDLLDKNTDNVDGNLRSEVHEKAIRLEETLASFRIEAKVVNITCGPTVTRFELKPAPGVKVSKISNLSNDIALSLAAEGVRIEAPIPGKSAVGIEIPNKQRMYVKLRDMIDGPTFRKAKSKVSICVGKDITGKNVVADLAKMPHMLVAGATGSGKSVFINSLILSLIYKSSPEDVRLIMIDPKKVELNVYNGIPHLMIPVVSNPNKAAGALNWAIKEMTDRYETFSKLRVRNLDSYNQLAEQDDTIPKMPRIVILIDELADLMQVVAGEVEGAICRLAQLARAAGMHLVIATQRPDVRVITGNIKANIPCRVAFAVNQFVDSKTILDGSGAEKLMPRGDMLFKPGGAPKPLRLQGAFVSEEEVEKICESIRVKETEYDTDIMNGIEEMANKTQNAQDGNGLSDDFDNLVPDAVKIIFEQETASTSMIQRKLRVGYNRAARLMDDMERLGIVGPPEGSKPREILMTHGHAMEMINGGKSLEE